MSIFGGTSHSTKSHRASSPARSSAGHGYYVRPNGSSSSYFGGSSSRGIFSGGGGGGSSYYKRRPRDNYIKMLWHKLQRMLRDLWSYARRHPVKAFFAVVVPLLSAGGAVSGLMSQFGFRLPALGGLAKSMGGGYYGSHGYGDFGGGGGGGGWMNNAGSLMSIAKAFM